MVSGSGLAARWAARGSRFQISGSLAKGRRVCAVDRAIAALCALRRVAPAPTPSSSADDEHTVPRPDDHSVVTRVSSRPAGARAAGTLTRTDRLPDPGWRPEPSSARQWSTLGTRHMCHDVRPRVEQVVRLYRFGRCSPRLNPSEEEPWRTQDGGACSPAFSRSGVPTAAGRFGSSIATSAATAFSSRPATRSSSHADGLYGWGVDPQPAKHREAADCADQSVRVSGFSAVMHRQLPRRPRGPAAGKRSRVASSLNTASARTSAADRKPRSAQACTALASSSRPAVVEMP